MGRKGGQSGRAVGHIADRLRVAVTRSLNILDRDKMPLDRLLAQAWKDDPIKTLSVVQRLLPQEFDVRQTISVASMHLEAVRELSKPPALPAPTDQPMPVVIDVEPIEKVGVKSEEPDVAGPGQHSPGL